MNTYYTLLQKRDPARNQLRYYLLDVQPNLFGTWSLVRTWGRIGYPGRGRLDLYDSVDAALAALRRKTQEKHLRGYVVQ
jgi:predicted DNA-binding WGR domain protein